MGKREKKQQKRLSLKTWCIIILVIAVFAGMQKIGILGDKEETNETDTSQEESVEQAMEQTVSEEGEEQEEPLHDIVVDGETIYGYYDVMREVGISNWDAVDVEKIEDWANGPRYGFQSKGYSVRVYCNMDGTIQSVVIGEDTALYLQGYETWEIDNFVVPTLYKAELMSLAKNAVEQCLNYPKTAKYPWLDWTYMRYFDLYTVSSTVEAQNAFGVPSEYGFTVKFLISDGTAKPLYLMLDGEVVLDKMSEYQPPERKETAIEIEQ